MERKTRGSLLSCRDQQKTRSSVSGFSTQVIRAKIYVWECASDWDYNKVIWFWFVKTACREKTCLAFALSRAQRVCNCAPQNVSLYNLYRNDGHKLRLFPSNWYNFLTISKSSVFSILFYLFNLQCLLFLVSPKVLNTYRNPSTGTGETRFVLAQRMSV